MLDPALDVGDHLPGLALVPLPIKVLGPVVQVERIDLKADRTRRVARQSGDQFGMRCLYRASGLWRQPARHQLADCRNNALSLGHGITSLAWVRAGGELQLAIGLQY